MIELALGFVLEHPAVTAAVVGPRTIEQLNDQLKAWNTVLGHDVLEPLIRLFSWSNSQHRGSWLHPSCDHSFGSEAPPLALVVNE